jgi:hypothetical protein
MAVRSANGCRRASLHNRPHVEKDVRANKDASQKHGIGQVDSMKGSADAGKRVREEDDWDGEPSKRGPKNPARRTLLSTNF